MISEATDAVIISDALRTPVTAQRLDDSRIIIRAPGRVMIFSEAEMSRSIDFVRNEPQLGHLQRFPVVAK